MKPAHEPLCNVLEHIASQSPDNAERVKQIIASLQAQLDRMTNHHMVRAEQELV